MPTAVVQSGLPFLTANANLTCFTGAGNIIGIFVSSASNTPLLTVLDSANANQAGNANAVVCQFVPVVGYVAIPSRVSTGLSLNISGNVVCTAFANRG